MLYGVVLDSFVSVSCVESDAAVSVVCDGVVLYGVVLDVSAVVVVEVDSVCSSVECVVLYGVVAGIVAGGGELDGSSVGGVGDGVVVDVGVAGSVEVDGYSCCVCEGVLCNGNIWGIMESDVWVSLS